MLVIRLLRTGRTNYPSFKIIVTDKKNSATKGRFVEELGFYNPSTKEKNIKGERVKYWIGVGAKPSPTMHNFLVREKIVQAKKIPNHARPKKKEVTPGASTQTPTELEKPKEPETKKEGV